MWKWFKGRGVGYDPENLNSGIPIRFHIMFGFTQNEWNNLYVQEAHLESFQIRFKFLDAIRVLLKMTNVMVTSE